ncbi:MAG: methyltransferase [Pseudomonadota bacterium]
MTDPILHQALWAPRPVEETLQIYANWAATYDADVQTAGYATPMRVAQALADRLPRTATLLDFGCGTGLSGRALCDAGFRTIDGTDISPEMLDVAQGRGIYRQLWQGTAGDMTGVHPGQYDAIVAAGVISLGAAPPDTLTLCLNHLAPGGILAVSFNDPTLADGSYDTTLKGELDAGRCTLQFRAHGDHLPGKGMGSDVIVLKRL